MLTQLLSPDVSRSAPLPAAERRQAIIKAARPLLIANGGRLTTKQVAEAAGIAEGTIFRVFYSKANLLKAVIADVLDPTELCEQIRALPAQANLTKHICALVTMIIENADDVHTVITALRLASTCDDAAGPQPRRQPTHDKAAHQQRVIAVRDALSASLTPWSGQLRVSTDQAGFLIEGFAMAAIHPLFNDHTLTDPALLADVLINGIRKD